MQSLASLEEKINPGQLESDKDRLLLINEKEHLLRELRSISSRTRSIPELEKLKAQCSRLEQDLNEAQEMSNRCIAGKCCSLELLKNNFVLFSATFFNAYNAYNSFLIVFKKLF